MGLELQRKFLGGSPEHVGENEVMRGIPSGFRSLGLSSLGFILCLGYFNLTWHLEVKLSDLKPRVIIRSTQQLNCLGQYVR